MKNGLSQSRTYTKSTAKGQNGIIKVSARGSKPILRNEGNLAKGINFTNRNRLIILTLSLKRWLRKSS